MVYGVGRYRTARSGTPQTSKEELLLQLYEGAIRFLNRSAQAFDDGRRLGEHKTFLSKGYAIISELHSTLDHEKGGAVATSLSHLYLFMEDQLTEANLQRKKEPILQVVQLLNTLLEGWRGAVKQVRGRGEVGDMGHASSETKPFKGAA